MLDVNNLPSCNSARNIFTYKGQRRMALKGLINNPVLNAIENFSQHASVFKISEARNISDCFSFKLVTIIALGSF